MTSALDGLSTYYASQASLSKLKSGGVNGPGGNPAGDPGAYLVEMEKNFSKMLNALTSPSGPDKEENSSSDYLSFLDSEQTAGASSGALNSAELQQLAEMEKNSALIGRTVSYYDPATEEQKSSKVASITFLDNGSPRIVTADGTELPVGSVTVIK